MGVAAAREVKSGVPVADGDDAQVRLPVVADLAAGGGGRRAAQRGHRRRAERGGTSEPGKTSHDRFVRQFCKKNKNSGLRVTYFLDESTP